MKKITRQSLSESEKVVLRSDARGDNTCQFSVNSKIGSA